MSDLYTELIVKRKTPPSDKVKKVLMIVGTVLAAFAGIFIHWIGLIVLVAFAAADYFLIPGFDLEYEYLYVNGELDIDKIMSRTKRKRVCSLQLEKMVLFAPSNSHELDYYNNNKGIRVLDYSSREEDHKVYAMIIQGDKGLDKILLEPNEVILNDIRRIAPSKVKLI